MPFRPLPETRVANALPGALLAAICINVLVEGNDVPRPLVYLGIVAGVALIIRGFRMAVLVADEQVTVRGLLLSRAVPLREVVTVSGGTVPMLRWRANSGQSRCSPIIAFADALGGMPRYAEHNRESLRQLRLEIGRKRQT